MAREPRDYRPGMRVAVVQVPSVSEGLFDLLDPRLDEAAASGASLAVLPEGVMHDFRPHVDLGAIAQHLDGPFVSGLAARARRLGMTIVAGMWERIEGETRPANTLVVVGADGSVAGTYRKIHLFDSFGFRESDRIMAGEPVASTFEVEGLRLGLATCYDLRFPELWRALAARGVDGIVLPAGWIAGASKLHHWRTLVTARAIENTAYVVAAGICSGAYTGHSMIVDPLGDVIVELGDEPAVGFADVGRRRVEEVRALVPSLTHRRM